MKNFQFTSDSEMNNNMVKLIKLLQEKECDLVNL